MPLDSIHQKNHGRNQQHGDPCPFGKLSYQHDHDRDAGGDRAESIHEHAPPGAFAPGSLPVHYHAGLGQRKGQKRSHGVERNQPVGDASEDRQQHSRQDCQRVDALLINEPPTSQFEPMREESIIGDGPGKAWKVGKRGVCRKREHQKNGAHGHPVKSTLSGDGASQLGEHTLVALGPRFGSGNLIGPHQISNAAQHHHQNADYDGERAAGILFGGLFECHDAVADGFDAGHGGTATRKRA